MRKELVLVKFISLAKKKFDKEHVAYRILHNDIEEVCINNPLRANTNDDSFRPVKIVATYDPSCGYFMVIDNFSWEFDSNAEQAYKMFSKYLEAMLNDSILIKRRRFFKWITFGKDITIIDTGA